MWSTPVAPRVRVSISDYVVSMERTCTSRSKGRPSPSTSQLPRMLVSVWRSSTPRLTCKAGKEKRVGVCCRTRLSQRHRRFVTWSLPVYFSQHMHWPCSTSTLVGKMDSILFNGTDVRATTASRLAKWTSSSWRWRRVRWTTLLRCLLPRCDWMVYVVKPCMPRRVR